jgi:hypothetical protein
MSKYEWPKFRWGSKRAIYVRDDDGVMRRVGTVSRDRRLIRLAGKMYTIYQKPQ